jgi:PAS domain S-box-containing protein
MLRAEMIKSEDGTPRRYLGVALDVTARNRSEARFRKSEALKESLLEASLDCIIAIDDQSRVVEWNDAAVRTFGYERKATLGQDLGDLIIPQQHRAAHRAGMERYLSTGEGPVIRNRIEIEGMRSDGTLFPVELAISPIKIGEQQFFTAFLRDITARRKGEAERLLLTRELSHRMKNTLAMVQAVVTQSLRNATSLEDASHLASERIQALGRAQDMLTESNWETADVRNVVSAALAPHLNGDCRFTIEGPSADLTAQQGMGLALAIHELATNATKYGALSSDGGHVMVSWTIEGGRFRFGWQETGGPTVSPPTHKGFGSRLTERVVPSYFSGTASMAYPKEGAVYVLDGSL